MSSYEKIWIFCDKNTFHLTYGRGYIKFCDSSLTAFSTCAVKLFVNILLICMTVSEANVSDTNKIVLIDCMFFCDNNDILKVL